ncbi:hypothetical protein ACFSVM_23015 [Paenibacillus shunpengii]|uniref:YfzA-like protein n=1 Tax=Paenibacillus shunpengii TaxID=2054424 RepID=A0ABW5SUJ8_9BACL|nr:MULTISPECIES: hypothetical protein [unclassified Paenibacillus]SDW86662.1 hypothetical protein SAMN05518848_103191 [Paenibacillus sp. PDC88]
MLKAAGAFIVLSVLTIAFDMATDFFFGHGSIDSAFNFDNYILRPAEINTLMLVGSVVFLYFTGKPIGKGLFKLFTLINKPLRDGGAPPLSSLMNPSGYKQQAGKKEQK